MRHCRVGVLHRQDFGAILFDSKPGPHFPIPSTNGREHHELGERLLGLTRTEVCGTIVEDWGSERRNSKSKHRCSLLCSSGADWAGGMPFFARYPPYVPQLFAFFFYSSRVRTLAPLSVVSNHRTFCSIIHYISTSGKTQHKSYEKYHKGVELVASKQP